MTSPTTAGVLPDRSPIERLPRVVAAREPRTDLDNSAHPMRVLTEDIAADRGAWTADSARATERFFDGLAADWDDRFTPDEHRVGPLRDALERGGPIVPGTVADVGAGTAPTSSLLQERFDRVLAVDLSLEMLRRSAASVPRIQADAARLPLPDGSLDAVVLMNAFLFPSEVARTLASSGVVVWISAIGPDTPIYLSADGVAEALPGKWHGVWSDAGDGSWAVLRRS